MHASARWEDVQARAGTSTTARCAGLGGHSLGLSVQRRRNARHRNAGSLQQRRAGDQCSGHITGQADRPVGMRHAFLYRDCDMTDLRTLGGAFRTGRKINNSGVVIGGAETESGNLHAFLYSAGVMRDLGTLGGSESDGGAIGREGLGHGRRDDSHAAFSCLPPRRRAHAGPGHTVRPLSHRRGNQRIRLGCGQCSRRHRRLPGQRWLSLRRRSMRDLTTFSTRALPDGRCWKLRHQRRRADRRVSRHIDVGTMPCSSFPFRAPDVGP